MYPRVIFMSWLPCIFAALCVGISKSGFPGVSVLTVALMAQVFPPMESTGILLPILIFGDLCAVFVFRKDVLWNQILRMLPPAVVGITLGFFIMKLIPSQHFGPVLGWLLLLVAFLQGIRMRYPNLANSVPHTRPFAWSMGIWAGIVTMITNAAGPVIAVYLLALEIPKKTLVTTSAWFFLIINLIKLPFSWSLGLLQTPSILLDLSLCPFVILGTVIGQYLLKIIPQKVFEKVLLFSASIAALKMVLS